MSDVRPGYKQTEVSVIPEDWEAMPLGKIGEPIIGLTYAPSQVAESGTLVLRSSNVQGGRLAFEDNVYVQMDVPERVIVREGDILVCVRNGSRDLIGKSALITRDAAGSAFGAFMGVVRSEAPVFVNALFGSQIVGRQVATTLGATINQITNANLRNLLLPWPPTDRERNAIAGALGDADAVIGALEVLIAKKRDIKQGAMLELLTGQRRLPGFQGDWVRKPMRTIFDFGRTIPLSRAQLSHDGAVTYVHYGDIHTRLHTHLDFETTATPRADKALCSAATPLQVGDWVFTDASEDYDGVAKAVEITNLPKGKDAVAGLHTMLLRERGPTFAPGFKGYLSYAPSFRVQVVRAATGMKVFGISKTQMKEIELHFPPIVDEQRAIATVLSDMDNEIAALDDKLAKARAVKQGMIQVLLTGEVRLV